ncbi:MAG: hypothetical protein ACQETE_12545 [Bacteroidota bacterium]
MIKRSLLFFFVLFPSLVYSQTDRIEYIRNQYHYINSNIDNFKKVEYKDIDVSKVNDPLSYSFETTEIYRLAMTNMVKYYDGDYLVKIELSFEGDRENLSSEYYFDKKGLLFVFKNYTAFHNPKWADSYDSEEKNEYENRYYFDSDNLIRWIDDSGEVHNNGTSEFIREEKQVYSDAKLYQQYESE